MLYNLLAVCFEIELTNFVGKKFESLKNNWRFC